MTWNIVADSSCDLKASDIQSQQLHFEVVPLKIIIGEDEYIDDGNLSIPQLLQDMDACKTGSSTACPSPEDFKRAFETADCTVCVTISGQLSGTYNAALLGRSMVLEEYPDKQICIIDSKSTAGAMVLPDGTVVTGKTSTLLGAASSLIMNALKGVAGVDSEIDVISDAAIEPICHLKTDCLHSSNPRLHSDETLIALSISAADNEDAKLALQQIPKLKGCQVHTSVLLSQVDILEFRKLGVELTCEPKSEHAKKLQK